MPGGEIMPLVSIWDYLRQRTRDAVLAGFEDALEAAEPNGPASSEYEAARKLRHRLEAVSALEAPAHGPRCRRWSWPTGRGAARQGLPP